MKALDYPPVWLIGAIAITWALVYFFPQTQVSLPAQKLVAQTLLGAGLVLMGLAVFEMTRAKTTIIPRYDPNALVTSGIFRFTRNPIYLGDLLVLGAGIFWWGSVSALPLLWIFKNTIENRFINGEEAKMTEHFGADFEKWAKKTRRWI